MYRVQIKAWGNLWASVVGPEETLEAAQALAAQYTEARIVDEDTREIIQDYIPPEGMIS